MQDCYRRYILAVYDWIVTIRKLITASLILLLCLPASADLADAVRFDRIVDYLTETSRANPTEDSLLSAARKALPDGLSEADRSALIRQLREADDEGKLQTEVINNMLASLNDPWAKLFTPTEAKRMRARLEGDQDAALGITIVRSKVPAYFAVIEVTPEGPADGKVRQGDKIISANGISTESQDFRNQISGEAGKLVELLLESDDGIRRKESVTLAELDSKTAYVADYQNGVIRISSFGEDTPQELQDALAEIGDRPVIIDLRHNGGGYVKAAVAASDLFLDKGDKIVTTVSRKEAKTYKAANPPLVQNPVCLLVNRRTASAAEIFTAALDNHVGAYVVGEKTYGKGSVQRFVGLPGGWALKYTTSLYQTPDDTYIDKIGLEPDRSLATEPRHMFSSSDKQLSEALQWRKKADLAFESQIRAAK